MENSGPFSEILSLIISFIIPLQLYSDFKKFHISSSFRSQNYDQSCRDGTEHSIGTHQLGAFHAQLSAGLRLLKLVLFLLVYSVVWILIAAGQSRSMEACYGDLICSCTQAWEEHFSLLHLIRWTGFFAIMNKAH